MAYSAGGLIEATDYNNFLNGTNQLNTVWGTGSGAVGYGQTALGTVSAGSTVTATQWATFINTLNAVRNHQSGAGTGTITAPTAGQTVTYLNTVATSVNTAYTNAGLYATQGSTTTGSAYTAWNPSAATNSAYSAFLDTNIVFASADQARTFFNAGGQLNWRCSATVAGTTRNQGLAGLINAIGGVNIYNTTNSGRTGSLGTVTNNNTNIGYRTQVYNSGTTVITSTESAPYASDSATVIIFTNDATNTNGANGNQVVIRLSLNSVADTYYAADPNNAVVNLATSIRCDVVKPESTYLTDIWTVPTISWDNA